MDAIVLAPMPQTPVQSPGQNGQSAGRNDASFGPMLSSAISGRGSAQKSPAAGTSQDSAPSGSQQLVDIEQIDDPGELEAFLAANNLSFQTLPPELQEMITAAFPAFSAGSGSTLSDRTGTLPPGMSLFPHDLLPQTLDRLLDNLTGDGDILPMPPPATQKQELTLILSQLQQIISANETTGLVVEQLPADSVTLDDVAALTMKVPVAEGSPRTAMAIEGMPSQNGLWGLQLDRQNTGTASAPAAATLAASQQQLPPAQSAEADPAGVASSTTLRQDMQPVSGAGTMAVVDENEQGAQQNTKQDNNQATLQSATTTAASAGSQSDQPVQTGIFSASLQDSVTTRHTHTQTGTLTLPSGTLVSEQEIINQVVQRFQMTTRLQSSKINIRLHPAELGELRIDLVVKEGSIKASVFAQNQHAQEILERNMPKLRTTLEQLGFTIDEIIVASRSETTNDFDLFDGQSARGQQFSFSDNTSPHPVTFEAVLDNSLSGTEQADSSLSIRA